jgi:hypothetical protein
MLGAKQVAKRLKLSAGPGASIANSGVEINRHQVQDLLTFFHVGKKSTLLAGTICAVVHPKFSSRCPEHRQSERRQSIARFLTVIPGLLNNSKLFRGYGMIFIYFSRFNDRIQNQFIIMPDHSWSMQRIWPA